MAPTEPQLVAIRAKDGKRVPKMMRWGLLPHWAKDQKLSYSTFNARSEEFTTKPAFKDAWKRGQRCLVVTDGFYEWKKLTEKQKQPYAIGMRDDTMMVMAGLWASWISPKAELVESCTILTTRPNELLGQIHNRMPVILGEQDWAKWLGEEPATNEELLALLGPCPEEWLKVGPVDKRVGNVRNKDRDLAKPV